MVVIFRPISCPKCGGKTTRYAGKGRITYRNCKNGCDVSIKVVLEDANKSYLNPVCGVLKS